MAITTHHPGQHADRRSGNKRQLLASVLQLAAAFSMWQVKRSQAALVRARAASEAAAQLRAREFAAIPHAESATPGAAESGSRAAKAGEREQHRDHAQSLQHVSYPKALMHVAIAAAKAWSTHRAASKGAALALYTLFSLAPMLVLVVTIAGAIVGEDTVRRMLIEQMSSLMGSQGGDAFKTILAGAQHKNSGLLAGLVSAALVLLSATSAFAELKDSLDELWEVPPSKSSGLWHVIRERFLSFGLILVLVLMLISSLAVSTALAALGNAWGGDTSSAFRVIALVISNIVSFGVLAGLFAVIFKYLPAARIAWKDVLIGALITAALFTIGKFLIGLYVAHANLGSSYGAAGSVVILITWIYYSAQIFFYGSLFTHEYAMTLGSLSQQRQEQAPANADTAGRALRPA
jgi:membrane protein